MYDVQVNPLNLPVAGSSEDYVPPEDVQFEQVWDPSVMLPSSEGAAAPPDPGVIVEEFKGAVSHDKVGGTSRCSAVGNAFVIFAPRSYSAHVYKVAMYLLNRRAHPEARAFPNPPADQFRHCVSRITNQFRVQPRFFRIVGSGDPLPLQGGSR